MSKRFRFRWPFAKRSTLDAAIKMLASSQEALKAEVIARNEERRTTAQRHTKELDEASKAAAEFVAKHVTLDRQHDGSTFRIATSIDREMLRDNSPNELRCVAHYVGRYVQSEIERCKFFDIPNRVPRGQAWRDVAFPQFNDPIGEPR